MMRMHAGWQLIFGSLVVSALTLTLACQICLARDTDIYSANVKNNSYILLDNSGSMGFGVYEQSIDYGAMYDYLITLNDGTPPSATYIWDTLNNWAAFYGASKHSTRRKIYLWKGNIGVTVATVDGKDIAFTGDAADPSYIWYANDLIDTHTLIDSAGNLKADDSGIPPRLTTDSDGHILLDGAILPLGMDIKLHNKKTLYDGSIIDSGLGGLLNAPGYYFSGYREATPGNLAAARSGDKDIYFFVTGNWGNMQAMYNLHYVTDNPGPIGAKKGDAAWKYERFPLQKINWAVSEHSLVYPDANAGDPTSDGGEHYAANLAAEDSEKKIVQPGAVQMQIHFSKIDLDTTQSCTGDMQ